MRVARQEVLFLLAEATAREGGEGPRKALRLLDQADDLARADGVTLHSSHARRARYLEQLGHIDEARRERDKADSIAPTGSLDWFLLGQQKCLSGDPTGAQECFDRALDAEELSGAETQFWARFFRALAHQKLKRDEEAIADLHVCIAARGNLVWPYLIRAFLHARKKNFSDAERDLDRADRCDPDRSARYVILANRGVLDLERNRPDLAVRHLQHAALLLPRGYHVHTLLAQAYWQRGDHDRARSALDYSVRLEPRNPTLYRTRARFHLENGRPTASLRDLDQAARLAHNPSEVAADHRDRARILYSARQYQEALTACRSSLKLRPNDPLSVRLEAETLLELGQPKEALSAFDRYVKLGKPDVELYRRRARARAALGDLAAVIEEHSAAIALRRDAATLTARGWSYLANGAARPALRDFESALVLQKSCSEALIGRGAARLELDRPREAVADVEEGLKSASRSSRLLYNAARVIARVAARNSDLRAAGKEKDRALELLRDSVQALPATQRGTFWRDQVRRDPAFRPIARLDGFVQLDRQFGQVEGRKPAPR